MCFFILFTVKIEEPINYLFKNRPILNVNTISVYQNVIIVIIIYILRRLDTDRLFFCGPNIFIFYTLIVQYNSDVIRNI